jgi:amino acid transporter
VALGGKRLRRSGLPTDPDLKSPAMVRTRSYERLVQMAETDGQFVPVHPGEVLAGTRAIEPPTRLGRAVLAARRLVLGPPLATTALVEERLSKLKALAILSSDALSSVAYGTEAMLGVLVLAGTAALAYSLPIAGVIVLLMVAVGLSYRQTIKAYPRGGGSYIVAHDNLGELPGLTAAAGLMTDYVLTVAVSVSAGVAAITSAVESLRPYSVSLALGFIALIVWGNLRGVRQSGTMFSVPTYAFVAGILALIVTGLVQAAGRGWSVLPAPHVRPVEALTFFLLLRAFASGCSAMTGVEAISDGVPAFRPPEWRNARTTLSAMVGLLAVMFAGITVLARLDGVLPSSQQTVLSQIAVHTFGRGPVYGYLQATTAIILLLAANTAFNDFPRLLYFLARDQFAPRMFLRMGDRLAHSNGILALALAAGVLVVAFGAQTDSLISLYAVGVFLSFTLSQSGMVTRWWRRREAGWRRGLPLNALGAVLSAAVLVVIAVTKFAGGAWVVVLLIPTLILLFRRIHAHYACAEQARAPQPLPAEEAHRVLLRAVSAATAGGHASDSEAVEAPDEVLNLTVVPVSSLDRPALRALAYAVSLGQPVIALHVSPDEEEATRITTQWEAWGNHVPLEVILSPFRVLALPLFNYLRALRSRQPELVVTVVLPEPIPARWWQHLLHNQVTFRLALMLRREPGIVVTSVPFHLPPC